MTTTLIFRSLGTSCTMFCDFGAMQISFRFENAEGPTCQINLFREDYLLGEFQGDVPRRRHEIYQRSLQLAAAKMGGLRFSPSDCDQVSNLVTVVTGLWAEEAGYWQ